MNKQNALYGNIMNKIAKDVKKILESVDIPENSESSFDFEVNDAIKLCLSMLESDGGAYLDWGAVNDIYKNVNSKKVADTVGEKFQAKGYYVYYQGMGRGSDTIYPGTPICVRIQKRPEKLSRFDTEFGTEY